MHEICLKLMGDGASARYPLGQKMTLIGSSSDCDIILDNCNVPEVVAKINCHNETHMIAQMASCAIKINGKKCRKSALNPGDRLEIGSSIFIVDTMAPVPDAPQESSDKIIESVVRFGEFVGHEMRLDTLLDKIISILLETIGGTDAFIFKLDSDGLPQVFVSSKSAARDDRFSDTIVQEALLSGKGICVPNALAHPQFSSAQSIADMKLVSALCCPIIIGGKKLGVIYLGSSNAAIPFRQQDIDVLHMFAVLAGMLIQHVDFISRQQNAISRLAGHQRFENIIGESKSMQKAFDAVESLAHSDIPVLLEGETGTGKDVIAQLIHARSSRSTQRFVVVNCSSLRGELLESELYGHMKGAFTGAMKDHDGLFAAANHGTLFLDEIGEMDLALQSKLLRTIETGKIRPVGSSFEKEIDVRIIYATNRDLAGMVEQGRFRQDLFYRINQFSISLPPLRDRDDDVVLLAYYFLEKFSSVRLI